MAGASTLPRATTSVRLLTCFTRSLSRSSWQPAALKAKAISKFYHRANRVRADRVRRVLVSFAWSLDPFSVCWRIRASPPAADQQRARMPTPPSASAAHARNMWPSIIMWTGHAEQRVLDCGGAAVEVEVTTPTSPTRRSGDCSSDVIVARTTRAPQRRESGTPATVSPLRTQRSGATQPSVVRTLRWAVSVSALVLLHVASGELPTMVHVCARDRAVYLASPHSPLYHSADVLSA
jgi:hypothetical protein